LYEDLVWDALTSEFHTLGSQTHPPVINDYNTDIQIMPFLIMLGKVIFKLLMVLAYSGQKSDSDLRQFNRTLWCVWKKHQKLHRKFGSLPLMVTIDQHTLAASFLVLNGQTPMFPSHEIHWNYCNLPGISWNENMGVSENVEKTPFYPMVLLIMIPYYPY
jgi:hypothetical protein